MEQEERIMCFEIYRETVRLVTTNGVSPAYPTSIFLCEIFEKLSAHFENNDPKTEFFNYTDPKGAWMLLTQFLNETDNLQNATIENYEEFRARYNISLDFKKGVYFKEDTTVLDSLISMRFERALDQWRIFDRDDYEKLEYIPEIFRYYSCTTMIDFVFALVHYMVFNKYKLAFCKHCGKMFATTTLKQKYCSRQSPFPGYTHLSCEQAVKNIKQELQRKKKRIYNSLSNYQINYGNTEINNFLDECAIYHSKIMQKASVENLKNYWDYLNNYKNRFA